MRKLACSLRRVGVLVAVALGAPTLVAGLNPAVAGAETCPNEALRVGLSANLPECRAYEMVTPVEKNSSEVDMHATVQSAPSGDAIAYASPTSLPNSPSSLAVGYKLARRSASGWGAIGIDPPQLNSTSQILTVTEAFSEDLSKSLVVSRVALAPGAVEGNGNIYLQDNTTGERTLIATSSNRESFGDYSFYITSLYLGGSLDLSHIGLRSQFALTPDSEEGAQNAYVWSKAGGPRLADRMPDGSISSAAGDNDGTQEPNVVSRDGRRIFLQQGTFAEGGLWVSTDGGAPKLISGSQRTGEDPTVPREAGFAAASADGSVVYFISGEPLTDSAVIGPGSTGDLYRYEVETGHLQDISPSLEGIGGDVWRLNRISADGSYAYFAAEGALVPGAGPGMHLYLWHNGVTKLVAALGYEEFEGTGEWSMSPDGNYFAFSSYGRPTGYDTSSTACPPKESVPANTCMEVYVYDAATERLACASCNPAGRPGGFAELSQHAGWISGYTPRNMLDDGAVFFDSTDALVPGDSNGTQDVYEWSGGSVKLISSGTGDQDAVFRDASPDGSNVFFTTGQQLVGQDQDNSRDLYDARVDGGFPPPVRAPGCSGTACQGVPPASPIFATPPSVTFNGVGNFEAPSKPSVKAKPKAKKHKPNKPKAKPRKRAKHANAKHSSRSTQRSTRPIGR